MAFLAFPFSHLGTHLVIGPLQALYLEDGTMLPDPSSTSRPPRPNSIEVKRNYPAGSSGAYAGNDESVYAARHARSPQDGIYRSVVSFVVICPSFVVIPLQSTENENQEQNEIPFR